MDGDKMTGDEGLEDPPMVMIDQEHPIMQPVKDQTVLDDEWWFSPYAEFEDFIGIGEERVKNLAKDLKDRVSPYVINRLLKSNGLPHGPTNTKEGIINI